MDVHLLPGQVNMKGQAVVQVGKSYPVLSPNWLSDDNFVDVIKFIPVLITRQR